MLVPAGEGEKEVLSQSVTILIDVVHLADLGS